MLVSPGVLWPAIALLAVGGLHGDEEAAAVSFWDRVQYRFAFLRESADTAAEFGDRQVVEWRRQFLDRPEYGGWRDSVVVDYGAGNCNLGPASGARSYNSQLPTADAGRRRRCRCLAAEPGSRGAALRRDRCRHPVAGGLPLPAARDRAPGGRT